MDDPVAEKIAARMFDDFVEAVEGLFTPDTSPVLVAEVGAVAQDILEGFTAKVEAYFAAKGVGGLAARKKRMRLH